MMPSSLNPNAKPGIEPRGKQKIAQNSIMKTEIGKIEKEKEREKKFRSATIR